MVVRLLLKSFSRTSHKIPSHKIPSHKIPSHKMPSPKMPSAKKEASIPNKPSVIPLSPVKNAPKVNSDDDDLYEGLINDLGTLSLSSPKTIPKGKSDINFEENICTSKIEEMIAWAISNPFKVEVKAKTTDKKKIAKLKAEAAKESIQNEKVWGNKMISPTKEPGKNLNSQWTTKLCEYMVAYLLKEYGFNVKRAKYGNLRPDFETYKDDPTEPDQNITIVINNKNVQIPLNDCIIEVKGRNYGSPGTSSEKTPFVALKYAKIPKIKLVICVAYEETVQKKYSLIGNKINQNDNNCSDMNILLDTYWNKFEYGSAFIGFTEFYQKIKELNA